MCKWHISQACDLVHGGSQLVGLLGTQWRENQVDDDVEKKLKQWVHNKFLYSVCIRSKINNAFLYDLADVLCLPSPNF